MLVHKLVNNTTSWHNINDIHCYTYIMGLRYHGPDDLDGNSNQCISFYTVILLPGNIYSNLLREFIIVGRYIHIVIYPWIPT